MTAKKSIERARRLKRKRERKSLTLGAAAKKFDVSPSVIESAFKSGDIRAWRRNGKGLRHYLLSSLTAYFMPPAQTDQAENAGKEGVVDIARAAGDPSAGAPVGGDGASTLTETTPISQLLAGRQGGYAGNNAQAFPGSFANGDSRTDRGETSEEDATVTEVSDDTVVEANGDTTLTLPEADQSDTASERVQDAVSAESFGANVDDDSATNGGSERAQADADEVLA